MLQDKELTKEKNFLKQQKKNWNVYAWRLTDLRRPLRGEGAIALRVGKIINKYKVAKHFEMTIEDNSFAYNRLESKIEEEALLDGFYIVRTSVKPEELSSEQVVSSYKKLSKVEQAFRCIKSVDLKLRPIYVRLEKRVRAHVLICMLAYYVEWEMRKRLAPILFEDETSDAEKDIKKNSVVAPAKRSSKAQAKARTKRTENGEPVHSFRTALNSLATICRNTIEFDCGKKTATFKRNT